MVVIESRLELIARRIWITGLGVVAASLLALPALSTASAQESSRHVLTGDQIAIYNIAGEALVTGGDVSDVVVEVLRQGADAEALQIDTGEIGGKMTLRVIYPGDRIIYRENGRGSRTTMRVRDDGTWGGSWSNGRRVTVTGSGNGLEAWADLKITIPRGSKVGTYIGVGAITRTDAAADLIADTHSGRVNATGVTGSLLVDTGSGRVNVAGINGDLSVDTGSGSVTATDCVGDRITFDTGSGKVTGEGLKAAYIEVDTGSGSIDIREE